MSLGGESPSAAYDLWKQTPPWIDDPEEEPMFTVVVKPEFTRPNLFEFVVLDGMSVVAFKGGYADRDQAQEEGEDYARQGA